MSIADGATSWITNVLSTIAGSPEAPIKGFLGVLYTLMYESGFYFLDGPRSNCISFDIRLLRELHDSAALLNKLEKDGAKYTADFSHKLMEPKNLKVVSFLLPGEINRIVVNFLLPNNDKVITEIFDPQSILKSTNKKLDLVESRISELSCKVKNILYNILHLTDNDVYPPLHILSLPPHILQSLCKYMDGYSFTRFLQTCKYVHENFTNDDSIWKHHSLIDFRGLNKLTHETWRDHYKYQYYKEKHFPSGAYPGIKFYYAV